MTLNEYQEIAMSTCMPSCRNFQYMFTNLVGELGELMLKIAKAQRKEQLKITPQQQLGLSTQTPTNEINQLKEELKIEAGDILWQLSGLCTVMGWALEDVGWCNLDKLASRQQRSVIDGNGDYR